MHRYVTLLGISIVIGWVMPASAQHHHHEGDIVVGRSLSGQLKVELPGEQVKLSPIISGLPGYEGWASDDPGFDALEADEVEEDFYVLAMGTRVYLMAAAGHLADALKVRDINTLAVLIDSSGGAAPFDLEELHTHVIWHVDSTVIGFNPLVTEYSGSFYLRDASGTYSDSDAFTLSFILTPEPAGLVLLAISGWMVVRRRDFMR